LAELDGVKDSKKLTDKLAYQLAATIKKVCPHSIVAIGPAKYNELYERNKNLNKLLSWGHAQAIENCAQLHPATYVISDQFGDPGYIRWLLEKKGIKLELVSMPRAEQDIAVAAASVLARAEFLGRLKRLGEGVGMDLPKGATNVIPTAKKLVETHGEAALANFVKLHFKTTAQVLG
jgi:ribonuclease HIII